ncbi:unnamed protein product [Bemisia tabaci]|uniref:Gonadal protein gdl n=2 Tax=Bemisia tabaci TaxID=7038 RepID=A0A9P0F6D4_BEMTA|nr:PREDICTED: protein DGCR6L [Bemisia tabaci]CAH0393912.1 unnamed protein product [Bemisia tabaci]
MDSNPAENSNSDQSDTIKQKQLYFLNEQLQSMVRELPPQYQQRLPYELLTCLAESLLDGTVFSIISNLMDIQHVTEKQLFQQRLSYLRSYSDKVQAVTNGDLGEEEKAVQLNTLSARHKEELKLFDMSIIMKLDEKVADQQRILGLAGVPGFEVTSDPIKIQLQIRLLDFILRISQMNLPFN